MTIFENCPPSFLNSSYLRPCPHSRNRTTLHHDTLVQVPGIPSRVCDVCGWLRWPTGTNVYIYTPPPP